MTRWLLIVIALVSLLANFLPVYQYGYARFADHPTIEGMEKAVKHIGPKVEQRAMEVMQSQKDDSS